LSLSSVRISEQADTILKNAVRAQLCGKTSIPGLVRPGTLVNRLDTFLLPE
jgi:hypothetical protein